MADPRRRRIPGGALLAFAVLAAGFAAAFLGDDAASVLPGRPGPEGSIIFGDDPGPIDDAAWSSAQLVVGPDCRSIVMGAGFLPWGPEVFVIPEIDVPTLHDAVGLPGDYTSQNSAWGMLSWHYERGRKTLAKLEEILRAEVAKRGCDPAAPVVDQLLTELRPRIRGWLRERARAL